MKDFKFVPTICKDKESQLKGHVVFSMPSYTERRKMIKALGVKINPAGGVDLGGKDHFDLLLDLVENCKKFIKTVAIENKETKEKHDNFDSLENDPYCDSLIDELAMFMLNGVNLGKKQG